MFYRSLYNRISSGRGVSRLVFILTVTAAVLAIAVLGVPFYHYIVDRSDAYGCGSALATANDQLKIYYLDAGAAVTAEEARNEVTKTMDGWDDLCPGGGDCYIVETDDPGVPYRVVCALHDDDVSEAALLNAKSALAQIETQLDNEGTVSKLNVTVNSKDFSAVIDQTETIIEPARKTLRKAGGALISYDVKDGDVVWFCYADENRVCVWDTEVTASDGYAYGWTVRRA